MLNACEGFSRALLIGVVLLLALQAMCSKESVPNAYLIGSVMTMMITLNFSSLEKFLSRSWVVTLSGGFLGALLLCFGQQTVFAVGIGLRSAAASLFSVCISLYIYGLHRQGRPHLGRIPENGLYTACPG